MNEYVAPAASLLGSFILGCIMGYGLKKILKIALVIVAGLAFIFIFLAGMNWIDANNTKILSDINQFIMNTGLWNNISEGIKNLGPLVAIGIIGGMILGFVKTS